VLASWRIPRQSSANRDFRYGPIAAPVTASPEPPVPSVSSSTRPNTSTAVILATPGADTAACFRV
jgi:hypothetical protein